MRCVKAAVAVNELAIGTCTEIFRCDHGAMLSADVKSQQILVVILTRCSNESLSKNATLQLSPVCETFT